ncbi:MAG: hypothetical protein N2555_06825 [Endomicrobia bacterium]|nr:hypothetical protein [Endomicrobiia bacterium]
MLVERRREKRIEVFLQGNLKIEGFEEHLPVWVKNISSYGMKLAFYRIFYCSNCSKLDDLLYFRCSESENCKLYNLENIVKFLSKGEIKISTKNENVSKSYQLKWFKIFPELSAIEFGVEFLN